MTKLLAFFLPIAISFLFASPSHAIIENINIGDTPPQGIPASTVIGTIISNVLLIFYIIGGLAVLIFFIWGALDWITAGGDKEKIAGARRKIINSFIGLALLALAAFIVSLFGQIVHINPLNMGELPRLDAPPRPLQAPGTTPVSPK